MNSIERVLTLWEIGVLSSDDVIAWADSQIVASVNPESILFDLSLYGPEVCLKKPMGEFPADPQRLSFIEEFSVRALVADLSSDETLLQFAKRVASSAIGEDLDEPFVRFGYQLDHLINDCDNTPAAIQLVRDELPSMLSRCQSIAAGFLDFLPGRFANSK